KRGSYERFSIIHDEELISKVKRLWQTNLRHSEMLRILQKFEGYPHLSSKQLKKLRLHHRFIHANRTLEQQELAQEYAEQEVRHHLRAGQSTRYGQVLA